MSRLSDRVHAGFAPIAMTLRARAALGAPRWGTILGYHDILPEAVGPYDVSIRSFNAQMQQLSRPPFLVSSLSEALESKDNSRRPRRVVIGFDDASRSFLEHAYPTLQRLGLPCIVYAPSALLGKPGYLTREELVELARRGVEIASHSRTHRRLTSLSQEVLEKELRGSKAELEDLIGLDVRHFAYPYGDWDTRVVWATRLAGYESAVIVTSGRIDSNTDRLLLYRSWPSEAMTSRWFEVLGLGYGDLQNLRLPRGLARFLRHLTRL